jgi:hypothetical protein
MAKKKGATSSMVANGTKCNPRSVSWNAARCTPLATQSDHCGDESRREEANEPADCHGDVAHEHLLDCARVNLAEMAATSRAFARSCSVVFAYSSRVFSDVAPDRVVSTSASEPAERHGSVPFQ